MIRRFILALALSAGLAPAFAQVPAPVPALPDAERRTSYSISGTNCACALNFMLLGDGSDFQNWVEVYLNGVRVNYNDATFGWTITSPSGTIGSLALPITNAILTFTNAQTGTVQIVGARRPRRTSQFNEGVGVPTRNFNVVFSDLTAQNREIWDKTNDITGRGLFSQPGNTMGPLPLPSACAGGFLAFDSTGLNPVCLSGGSGSGNVVGPATSTVGDLAVWNNITGTLLKDQSLSSVMGAALCTTSGAFPIYNATTGQWVCSTAGGTGSLGILNGPFTAVSLTVTGAGINSSFGSGGTGGAFTQITLNGESGANGGFVFAFQKNATINWYLGDHSTFAGGSVTDWGLFNAAGPGCANAIDVAPSTSLVSLCGALTVSGVATLANGAALGTPASVTLTNATGLPVSTGLSGAGTGILAALGVNVGTAGAPIINGGALGTPSSGVATNLTGTASGLTAGAVPAANLTGATLASGVTASSLTSFGGSPTFTGTATFVSSANAQIDTSSTLHINNITGISGSLVITAPSSTSIELTVSGGTILLLQGSELFPFVDTGIALGDASHRFGGIFSNSATISGIITAASTTATPAGGSTAARLIFGTTAGFGIYYGSGLPTVSAAQGSIYIRSDGSSTSTRLYVNTTGSTTWTNFTSASWLLNRDIGGPANDNTPAFLEKVA